MSYKKFFLIITFQKMKSLSSYILPHISHLSSHTSHILRLKSKIQIFPYLCPNENSNQ